jgi:hypothetical protein
MATFEERLDSLKTLSADEREELRADLIAAFEAADETEDIDTMEYALMGVQRIEMFEELINDVNSSVDAEEAARLAEQGDDEGVETEGETEGETETEGEADGDEKNNDPGAEDAEGANIEESKELAMAASAVTVPGDTVEVVEKAQAPVVASIASVPVAGADIKGLIAGAQYDSTMAIDEAMVEKINSVRGSHGGDGEKRTVVSLRASIPNERQLDRSDVLGNMTKIDNIASVQAITASGGYCAPLPVNYDIYGVGSNIRPVRDSLPTFGATRGGIRYIQPPVLGAYTSAISLWTAANDASPSSPAVKPHLQVTCASEVTATTDAVTLSLVFGNLVSRAYPELVQRHNQLALVQHARFAEQSLLNKIAAASTAVTSSYVAGYGRDILRAVARAAAAYRNRNRVPRGVKLRAIMPEWVLDAIREDIAASTHFEALAETDATINSWLDARNINITWHMDDTFSSQSAGALNDFPATIKWWLFAEGTFLFLDGGILDLGVVRDSSLIDTNDYRTFVETFEGIAKVGTESLQITTTSQIGLAPVANVSGSTIFAP